MVRTSFPDESGLALIRVVKSSETFAVLEPRNTFAAHQLRRSPFVSQEKQ